jgi:rubrerythrin
MIIEPAPKDFLDRLNRQVADEESAVIEYQELAQIADNLGRYSVGTTLRQISNDESRHKSLLSGIVKQVSWVSESLRLDRPFPQTYNDWADLGIDLGAKDPSIKDEVYNKLQAIYNGTSEADEAKRWLVRKAGELGVT